MKAIIFAVAIVISTMFAFHSVSYVAAEANPEANAVSFIQNTVRLSYRNFFEIIPDYPKF